VTYAGAPGSVGEPEIAWWWYPSNDHPAEASVERTPEIIDWESSVRLKGSHLPCHLRRGNV
jgi:hypothetical protein